MRNLVYVSLVFLLCFHIAENSLNSTDLMVYSRKKRSLFSSLSSIKTVCYNEVGCFWSGPPFQHPVWRPISVPPLPPEAQNTLFYLYTRGHRDEPLMISPLRLESAATADFKPSSWTRILIPGVVDKVYSSAWMNMLKNNYLAMGDENVIFVNYGNRNPLPYFLTVANGRVIGAQIAQFIEFICRIFGAHPGKIHIIGNRLGAHIAGYAGERVLGLGRITGLDPSGPYFRNVPNKVELENTDAIFVDVIHSNAGRNLLEGAGTFEDVGHVNFWPNGGRQRGCLVLSPIRALLKGVFPLESIRNTITCRHLLATEYFAFSFNQNACLFVGVECESYDAFQRGFCNCGEDGKKCRIMGQFSEPALYESRYYLQLSKERPYCLHQYQVILHIEVSKEHKAYGSIDGIVELKLKADTSGFHEKLSVKINLQKEWQIQKFLLTFKSSIGKPEIGSAVFHFKEEIKINLASIEINYLLPVPKKEVSTTLCKDPYSKKRFTEQTVLTSVACNELVVK